MSTTFPYTVTITKPSYEPVHLGFPFWHEAETACTSLRRQLTNTAHPAGTTIAWAETPDGISPLPPLNTGTWALAEAILAAPDQSHWEPGAEFPDLFSRLQAQEGTDRAMTMFREACQIVGAIEAEDEAESE